MTETMSILERVEQVQSRIASACERAGRSPEMVRLVAVSKKQPPEAVEEAAQAGLYLFGENRVQEAMHKIPECRSGVSWHLIGHLQTNKVKPAVQLFDMIHSVDSLRLLEAVNTACVAAGLTRQVLIQVNTAGERSKYIPQRLRRRHRSEHGNIAHVGSHQINQERHRGVDEAREHRGLEDTDALRAVG